MLMAAVFASCTSTRLVYRLSADEPLAKAVCKQVAPGGSVDQRANGWWRCSVLHQLHFDVSQSGTVLRIAAPRSLSTEISLRVGQVAAEHHLEVELVESD